MRLSQVLVALPAAAALLLTGGAAVQADAGAAPQQAVTASTQSTQRIAATDAPQKIHVGAPTTVIPLTVITKAPAARVGVSLTDPRTGAAVRYVSSEAAEAGRPAVFKAKVDLLDREVQSWGRMSWDVEGYSSRDVCLPDIVDSVAADMRAHSLLGMAVSRRGSTVDVRGAARAYNTVVSRYAAWSGLPVSVQRWDGAKWVQVRGVKTDARGNLAVSLALPQGSTLRLVVGDTPSIWGAVSATASV